jgi:hypothetical protein
MVQESSKWVGIGWIAVLVVCLVAILLVVGILALELMGGYD